MEIGENFLKAKFTAFEILFSPIFHGTHIRIYCYFHTYFIEQNCWIFFSLKKNMSALNCIYCIGIHMKRNGNTDVHKNSAYSRQTWVKYTHIGAVISFVLNWLLPFYAFYAYSTTNVKTQYNTMEKHEDNTTHTLLIHSFTHSLIRLLKMTNKKNC